MCSASMSQRVRIYKKMDFLMLRGILGVKSGQKVLKKLGQCLCLVVMQHVTRILQGGDLQICD